MLSNNNFSSDIIINDIKYKCFSIEELENNSRIMAVNNDLISVIKEIDNKKM